MPLSLELGVPSHSVADPLLQKETTLVCPGDAVGAADSFEAGDHVYLDAVTHQLRATICGLVQVKPRLDAKQKPLVHVVPLVNKSTRIPQIGERVTARVTRINARFATCVIVCIGDALVPNPGFPAQIKAKDVRQHEIDTVAIADCFRPGDLVLADVLSMGDHRSFYLTTALNELGVIEARSEAAEIMLPVSWTQMQCPLTHSIEPRKVARIETSKLPT